MILDLKMFLIVDESFLLLALVHGCEMKVSIRGENQWETGNIRCHEREASRVL